MEMASAMALYPRLFRSPRRGRGREGVGNAQNNGLPRGSSEGGAAVALCEIFNWWRWHSWDRLVSSLLSPSCFAVFFVKVLLFVFSVFFLSRLCLVHAYFPFVILHDCGYLLQTRGKCVCVFMCVYERLKLIAERKISYVSISRTFDALPLWWTYFFSLAKNVGRRVGMYRCAFVILLYYFFPFWSYSFQQLSSLLPCSIKCGCLSRRICRFLLAGGTIVRQGCRGGHEQGGDGR